MNKTNDELIKIIGSPNVDSKAYLLKKFIKDNFENNGVDFLSATKHFASYLGVSSTRVKEWLEKDAIVIDKSVFLMATLSPETKNQKSKRLSNLYSGAEWDLLADVLNKKYKNNQSRFAREKGLVPQQVSRWINAKKCILVESQVYRFQRVF